MMSRKFGLGKMKLCSNLLFNFTKKEDKIPTQLYANEHQKSSQHQKLNFLSQAAQRALWAASIIDLIRKDPPAYEELKQKSLHQRILELKKPVQIQFSQQLFSDKIEQQIKQMFLPKKGIQLKQQYFQPRTHLANNSQNVNPMFTFYPTYTGTGQIFNKVVGKDRIKQDFLFYGKSGSGKSMTFILCCTLLQPISFYLAKFQKQFQCSVVKKYVYPYKFIYWSIKKDENQEQFIKRMCLQIKQLWPGIRSSSNDKYDFKQLTQKQRQKLFKAVQALSYNYPQLNRTVIIDQINQLASQVRQRKRMKLTYGNLFNNPQITLEQNLQLIRIQKLQYFKSLIQFSGQITIFNSSNNIEQDLVTLKTDGTNLQLGRPNLKKLWTEAFNYQKKIQKLQGNLGFLQLSQIFSHLLNENVNFSSQIRQQWIKTANNNGIQKYIIPKQYKMQIEEEFRKMEWNILPTIHLINNTLQMHKQSLSTIKNTELLKQKIIQVFKKMKEQMEENFTINIAKFLTNSLKFQSAKHKKQFSQQQLLKILENFVPQRVSIFKQMFFFAKKKLKQQKQIQLPNNKLNFSKEICLKTAHKSETLWNFYREVDRQLFSISQGSQTQTITLTCNMSPEYFIHLTEKLLMLNESFFQKFYSKEFFQLVKNENKSDLGRQFQALLVNALREMKFILSYSKVYQLIFLKEYYIDNFKQNQKGSLFQKLGFVKSQMEKNELTHVLCIPYQFAQNSSQTNYSFDLLFVEKIDNYIFKYSFIDVTISTNSKQIFAKYIKFLKMLACKQQYLQLYQTIKTKKPAAKKVLKQVQDIKTIQFIVYNFKNYNEEEITYTHLIQVLNDENQYKQKDKNIFKLNNQTYSLQFNEEEKNLLDFADAIGVRFYVQNLANSIRYHNQSTLTREQQSWLKRINSIMKKIQLQ